MNRDGHRPRLGAGARVVGKRPTYRDRITSVETRRENGGKAIAAQRGRTARGATVPPWSSQGVRGGALHFRSLNETGVTHAVIQERAAALEANRFHRGNRRILADRVRSINEGQAHVLELGAGHLDFTTKYLLPASGQVVATDLTPLFPDDLELPEGLTFQRDDALALSFGDESFDCVIALEVIEHVPDEDSFLREGLRVLRRGGKFIFTTPNRHRLTALARYAVGRPIRFPHTYAVDPVLGDITHLREYSYGDFHRLVDRHRDLAGEVEIEGIGLGVPAWQALVLRSGPLHRLAFNWHVTVTRR
jgi:ubiquinone/menaquinone biosynthesis C-methylase UbiE